MPYNRLDDIHLTFSPFRAFVTMVNSLNVVFKLARPGPENIQIFATVFQELKLWKEKICLLQDIRTCVWLFQYYWAPTVPAQGELSRIKLYLQVPKQLYGDSCR